MSGEDVIEPNEGSIEHERLKALVNSMADAVVAIDKNLSIVLYNGAALDILDLNGNISDKQVSEVIHLLDENNQKIDIDEHFSKILRPESSRNWQLAYGDGNKINLYLSIAPVNLGYGSKIDGGFVILMRDITREKSLEEERDEFISVVSHELRTPIAIAEANISNAQFMYDKSNNIDPTIKESLKQAHDQVLFLASMMNDLSTLSRAERGKLELDIEEINVRELLESIKNSYEHDAKDKDLGFKIETEENIRNLLSGKLYVREILQNFVTNALKYTEEGSITVGASSGDNGVKFFVRDTGIGISKSDQEKVFDKFFRSEDYRTRQSSGTGLGLYVTVKLARLIHGEIDLVSELNKGTTFSIFVPNLQA